MPPLADSTITSRVRVLVPPPHGLLQLDHAFHAPSWQLTGIGHDCVLHDWDSSVGGQGAPMPLCGFITSRLRVFVPPPHLLEQSDQALQSPTTQSCLLPAISNFVIAALSMQ